MSDIEVERRAILDDAERQRICERMLQLGEVSIVNRVMVVYPELQNGARKTLRINNGVQEIVTKSGGTADAVRQQITEYPTTPLRETLRRLANKGFTSAIVGRRVMQVVELDGVEISLRDVLKFDDPNVRISTLLEVEALDVAPGEEATALQRVGARMEGLRVKPMSGAEFEEWVAKTHAAADQPFEYSSVAADALARTMPAFATR